MKEYKDQEILEGILNHDHRVLNFVYNRNLPIIENMVIQSGGNANMAKDIFQESMIIVYQKIKSERFQLTCRFGTYLYSVCRNLFIQEIKYGDRVLSKSDSFKTEPIVEEPEQDYKKAVYDIFEKHYNELSSDCKRIIDLYFKDYSTEQIRDLMGYKDTHYVMDKKYRCKRSLIKRILNDPAYKAIKNGLLYPDRKIY